MSTVADDLDLVERAVREIRTDHHRWSFLSAPSPLAAHVGRVAWRLRHPEAKMIDPYDGRWARRRLDALVAEGRIVYERADTYYEFRHHISGAYVKVRFLERRSPNLPREARRG